MEMEFNIDLQQKQKIIITHELREAINILQYTSYELQKFVERSMEDNPLLEIDEDKYIESSKDSEDDKGYIDSISSEDYLYSLDNRDDDRNTDTMLCSFSVNQGQNLQDYLREQLKLLEIDRKSKSIASYMVSCIDENGYLKCDIDILRKKINVSHEYINRILSIVQNMDPAGVGARDLKECLVLQLKRENVYNDTIKDIIENMLIDIAKGDIRHISLQCGVSMKTALGYVNIIKGLNPKPGASYSDSSLNYVYPDIIIESVDGKLSTKIKNEPFYNLTVNNNYKKIMANKGTEEYYYVKEKLQSAMWIIKSIEHRNETIKKVMDSIINLQEDYFHRRGNLNPMTMNEVADMSGVNVSTVSRAIKGKYVQTPRGVHEIKSLFKHPIKGQNGIVLTSDEIKNMIKGIIEREDPHKPFSDKYIAEMLSNNDAIVSRRTVNKYREEMGIKCSSKRKI